MDTILLNSMILTAQCQVLTLQISLDKISVYIGK